MKASTIRTLTKIGMVGSLAALFLPHFHGHQHGRHGRDRAGGASVHTWAGIALVGFAVWHYHCYQPPVWVENGSGRE